MPFNLTSPTFREDILKTSSDLYVKRKIPELVSPTDGTSLVGVVGSRDSHSFALSVLTHNEKYGFEDCQANLVRMYGLQLNFPEGEAEKIWYEIAKNPESISPYLKAGSFVLLRKQNDDIRSPRWSGSILRNILDTGIIPCQYNVRAENGSVILPKFEGNQYLGVGYSPVHEIIDLFGADIKNDNTKRDQLERVLAETWNKSKGEIIRRESSATD